MKTTYQRINFYDPQTNKTREVTIEAKTLDEAITIIKLRFGQAIKFYSARTIKA